MRTNKMADEIYANIMKYKETKILERVNVLYDKLYRNFSDCKYWDKEYKTMLYLEPEDIDILPNVLEKFTGSTYKILLCDKKQEIHDSSYRCTFFIGPK
jgi:hypothetical protein